MLVRASGRSWVRVQIVLGAIEILMGASTRAERIAPRAAHAIWTARARPRSDHPRRVRALAPSGPPKKRLRTGVHPPYTALFPPHRRPAPQASHSHRRDA